MSISGPLPPPQLLAEYAKVIDSAPERMMRIVETRSETMRAVANEEIRDSREGRWMAFVLTWFCLLLAAGFLVAAARWDEPVLGTGIGFVGVPVTMVIQSFRRSRRP